MRMTMIAAAVSVLALTVGASAQSASPDPQGAAAQPQGAAGQKQSGAGAVRTLSIVDISELPDAAQKQVNEIASKASPDDLDKLHKSIDSSPQIKSALAQKGLTSKQVIAANMSANGSLTLVTKKTT